MATPAYPFNPYAAYSAQKTPYQNFITKDQYGIGQLATQNAVNPTAVNPNIAGSQAMAGLGFAQSVFGYGGSLNPEDIELQKENRIDSDNPYLSGSVYNKNLAASDVDSAKSKAKGAALGTMASGAALGSVIPGIGTLAGAAIGGIVGLIGVGSAASKAKKAQKEAMVSRAKNINSYNKSVYSANERDVSEQRSSMYKNGFNTNLMSLV